MPYIEPTDRKKYDEVRQSLNDLKSIETKGDLEYLIYLMMLKYMDDRPEKYGHLHDCVYGVKHSAHEFERHRLDAREDYAKDINGDITLDRG